MKDLRSSTLAIVIVLVFGCGGRVIDEERALPTEDASSDATASDGSPDSPKPSPCPSVRPSDGDACTLEGLVCKYDGDCVGAFRAICRDGTFGVDYPMLGPSCPTKQPAEGSSCPSYLHVCEIFGTTTCQHCVCNGIDGWSCTEGCTLSSTTCKSCGSCSRLPTYGCEVGGKCGCSCSCGSDDRLHCSCRPC